MCSTLGLWAGWEARSSPSLQGPERLPALGTASVWMAQIFLSKLKKGLWKRHGMTWAGRWGDCRYCSEAERIRWHPRGCRCMEEQFKMDVIVAKFRQVSQGSSPQGFLLCEIKWQCVEGEEATALLECAVGKDKGTEQGWHWNNSFWSLEFNLP